MDSPYKNTISALPHTERITYCENFIDKAQLNLVRNKKYIDNNLVQELNAIIVAAQLELKNLQTQKIKFENFQPFHGCIHL